MTQLHYDVVIIGAGAAGMVCAIQAGYRGLNVLLLDHAPKPGAKIRISGGGKCNFTNRRVEPKHFICANPHFVKSALARYQPEAFIEWVERHNIAYEERDNGQLFTLEGAGQIVAMLRTELDWAGVELQLNCDVVAVIKQHETWSISTSQGQLTSAKLVVATGGLSYPKLRASDFGMKLAKQYGLEVIPSRPGLVPLQMPARQRAWWSDLSGLSLEVAVTAQRGPRFEGAMLITHQGLSGPCILQVSNYWQPGEPISLNLLPDVKNVAEWLLDLKQNAQSLSGALKQHWPKRLVQAWQTKFEFDDHLANYTQLRLDQLGTSLTAWSIYPDDTAGYAKAEVSLGGVSTDEVSSKTFETHKVSGLYFIGEVLDVTGHLGGFNFQWAWASAHACAQDL
ncbi:membrane protein [Thiomicrospira aerophila AL3]|uniref:Membrane protein n=1 Tax=Thiomicrospira aerophila AL3 TaxID=717772 RepID=W0DP76_9GAMM|nr:NAD(P)/FAD-dependent oxidoreductase [Thiomicrospira aerophila]AHF00415.1 membrane protein [Thiomicrospira aerophila AL3]